MPKETPISLSAKSIMCGDLQFTSVDVIHDPPGPIVRVYYAKDGLPQPSSLRLDTGKGVFLDHVATPSEEKRVVDEILNHLYATLYQGLATGASGD